MPGKRHFDVAGAASVTAALMLFVYAMTYATSTAGARRSRVALLPASARAARGVRRDRARADVAADAARDLPVRTLPAGNAITVILASVAFSSFFLLALYLQQVEHYSAAQAGVAFTAIALPIATLSNFVGPLVRRFGARSVLLLGLLLIVASEAWLMRLPVHATYLVDLLPAFLLLGVGMALSWVPVTIASLAGVAPADSGVASGISNTARQVGGAVGLAVVSTVAATYGGTGAAGQTHGFHVAFGALLGLAVIAVGVTAAFLGPREPLAREVEVEVGGADPGKVLAEAA